VAYFSENQVEFNETQYGTQFDEVIKLASKYTRAPIVIRGHTDTTLLVATILKKGIATGLVKQAGSPGNYSYSIDGKPLDLNSAKQVLALANQPNIDNTREDPDPAKRAVSPSRIAEAATALSRDRAQQVRNALIAYASKKGSKLDESQIQVVGAGANDPFIVKPRSADEAAKNRRVEFSIVRVSAEAATASDYEL
jgi:outer membrane protein OmpA-like peptidoglycan-associated protein